MLVVGSSLPEGRTQISASGHKKAAVVVLVLQVGYGLGRCPEPEDHYNPLLAPGRVHEHASTRPSMLLRYATSTTMIGRGPALTRKTP